MRAWTVLLLVCGLCGCASRHLQLTAPDGTQATVREQSCLYRTGMSLKARKAADGAWEIEYARETDVNAAAIEAAAGLAGAAVERAVRAAVKGATPSL